MTDKRLKIADTTVSDDHRAIKFDFYHADQFVGEGDKRRQAVRDSTIVDVSAFPADMLTHCACVGFASIAAGRYRRTGDHAPEPETVVTDLAKSMQDGTWTPGRETGPREPTPFVEALADLTKTPTHVIETDMENRTKWTRSYTAHVRNDPRVAAKVAQIIEARAKRDAQAARERGKGQSPALNLGSLFDAPQVADAAQ